MKSLFAATIGFLLSGGVSIGLAEPVVSSVQRVYPDASKADVWQAVMTDLASHDLPIVTADFERGKIRARQHNYLNTAWARCASTYRRSFDPTHTTNLRARSAPIYRGVDLRLEIVETAMGTTLSLSPSYSNVGRDHGRRAFAFQIPCQSTGVLEQALFTASGNAG